VDELRKRRCECGAADCTSAVEISLEEEDAVDHSGRNRWILALGHEVRGARSWRVIGETDRFVVVETEEWHDP
jgi:hypothetical protein